MDGEVHLWMQHHYLLKVVPWFVWSQSTALLRVSWYRSSAGWPSFQPLLLIPAQIGCLLLYWLDSEPLFFASITFTFWTRLWHFALVLGCPGSILNWQLYRLLSASKERAEDRHTCIPGLPQMLDFGLRTWAFSQSDLSNKTLPVHSVLFPRTFSSISFE